MFIVYIVFIKRIALMLYLFHILGICTIEYIDRLNETLELLYVAKDIKMF